MHCSTLPEQDANEGFGGQRHLWPQRERIAQFGVDKFDCAHGWQPRPFGSRPVAKLPPQVLPGNRRSGVGKVLGPTAIELGSRILQTWDAFTGPGVHNRRVRELRARTGLTRIVPYVSPSGIGLGIGFQM